MGEISKQVFKHFAEFECDRQLFIDLGEHDPRWLAPLRTIERPPFSVGGARSGIAELGRAYERSVYDLLTRNPAARFKPSLATDAPVVPAPLDAPLLVSLHEELTTRAPLAERYLLEHAWVTPSAFVDLALGPGAAEPLVVTKDPGSLRPDLLVVGNAFDAARPDPVLEVLPDGRLRALTDPERASRVGINVMDIKHVHEQGVGRGHLIEILYYALALSAQLDVLALRDRFFVRADGNGIFPKRELAALATLLAGSPRELIVPLAWRDTVHLFESTQKRARELRQSAPRAIETVDARIQPACGRCPYLEDCKQSLQPGTDPATWDLALLPNLRQGTAEQLRALGFRTVGDVAERVRDIQIGTTPQPIYAEIAPLELKARALRDRRELAATPENTAGQRMLSIALPRFTNIDLFFNLETDPTNEVVFALALGLDIDAHPSSVFLDAHNAWWTFWKRWLDAPHHAPDFTALDAQLDPRLIGPFVSEDPSARIGDYRLFAEVLKDLARTSGARLAIKLPGELIGTHTLQAARLSYEFSYINSGARGTRGYQDGERVVAERAVTQLFNVLALSQCYEEYVRIVHVTEPTADAPAPPESEGEPEGEGESESESESGDESKSSRAPRARKPRVTTRGPAFAAYYWSREQLEHCQDLLERHLPGLIGDAKLRERFLSLLEWLAPSESGVTHYLQHMKVFNLREFVESSVGIPEIINATWHGIDEKLPRDTPMPYARKYWAPHFNHMDFAVWHEYIDEPDANRQTELREDIVTQLRRKLWALRRILRHYRRQAGEVIAQSRNRPAHSGALREKPLPPGMHPLAHVWFLYSRLNAAMQDLEAEHNRTTYPAQSIAGLVAAEVIEIELAPRNRIRARVTGLSANAKFVEGDYVLLLPESQRDASGGKLNNHRLTIEEMEWDGATQSFSLTMRPAPRSMHPLLFGEESPSDGPWFLYGATNDAWSPNLYSLLQRKRIGASWLGHRLALQWSVGSETSIHEPKTLSAGAPELYLFAPHLLPSRAESETPLRTTQHPPPDPSQQSAIRLALSSTISCVQGPPGTGKSQTIAALIDEFLYHREGPARILVTAFSYSALSVVLDKVRSATDARGNPTRAAQTQLVWLRSQSRDPIADEPGRPHVFDLTIASKSMLLDGKTLSRRKPKPRLDNHLNDRFILFANAFSLCKLGAESRTESMEYEFIGNGFGFDLIIVDEASQLPANQLLASAALVRPFDASLRFIDGTPTKGDWPLSDRERLQRITADGVPPFESLTRYVIVGDHNQLPPVQAVKPPAKLQRALDSAFHYYVQGHGVAHRQLRRNYRSRPTLVEYTRQLELYEAGLEAFRETHPYADLPPPPADEPDWIRQVLADDKVVGTLIHARRHETAVSPLEAKLAADLALAFYRQMDVRSDAQERAFWQEHLGIVAPHNAQGRLIARSIYDRLTGAGPVRTRLSDRDLMTALRATIYSVEKFQGSDRTFIIGSVALSSRDQLAAEEAFIYDVNRFNVLTSRAKQKMLLLCSESFLDYIPRDRDVFAYAARVRKFAYAFCDIERPLDVRNERDEPESPGVRWRFRQG
jgi:hypothetical protein